MSYALAILRYGRPLEDVIADTDDHRDAALDAIRNGHPFYQRGIAHYELMAWNPVIGAEELDKLGTAPTG